jgi:hypothetical protein
MPVETRRRNEQGEFISNSNFIVIKIDVSIFSLKFILTIFKHFLNCLGASLSMTHLIATIITAVAKRLLLPLRDSWIQREVQLKTEIVICIISLLLFFKKRSLRIAKAFIIRRHDSSMQNKENAIVILYINL